MTPLPAVTSLCFAVWLGGVVYLGCSRRRRSVAQASA